MEILEKELKGRIIHDFPYPLRNRKCPHTSLISLTNPGGCLYSCPICYARAYSWSISDKIIIYQNLVEKLSSEIEKLNIAFPFYLSQITDPLQPIKKIRELTFQIVKLLMSKKLSFKIVTKSAEGTKELVDTNNGLLNYPYWFLEMTVESTPKKQIITSPNASPIKERIKIIKYLTERNIEVIGRTDPTILGFIDWEDLEWLIANLKEAGVRHIIASSGYYNKVSMENLLNRMKNSIFRERIKKVINFYQYHLNSKKKRFFAPLSIRIEFHKKFKKLCEENNLTYAVCQELPKEFDSKNLLSCEGSKRNFVHIKINKEFIPINCCGDCLRSCPDLKNPPCKMPIFQREYPYKERRLYQKFYPSLI
ncbi:MAG: radical SAM protein [candidate division WOR-3 bacterium]